MRIKHNIILELKPDKRRIVSAAIVILFIAVLKISSNLSNKICQFYLQIQEINKEQQGIALWSVNDGSVHKYVSSEGDTINFNLALNEVDKIKNVAIIKDGYGSEVKVCSLTVITENGRIDYGPEQILENFQLQGINNSEIKEDGLLWISTDTSKWEIKSLNKFVLEINKICKN